MSSDIDPKIDSNAINNIEQESRLQNHKLGVVIIFVILILGIGFYGIWGMVLNKGTIVFNGETPFDIIIGNIEVGCLDNECKIDLPAHEYDYNVLKDGYYDQNGFVDIVRGETAYIDLNLKYIPGTLRQVTRPMFSLPVGYSKFTDRLLNISLFAVLGENIGADTENTSAILKKLPKKPVNIVFSKSGKKAMVFESGKDGIGVAIYDTASFTMKDIYGIQNMKSGGWGVSEQEIYVIVYDESAKQDVLKRVCLSDDNNEDCKSENLVYFLRSIQDYEIIISPNNQFVAILDKTQEAQIVYIIDVVHATRTNIFEGYFVELGDWSADGEVFVFNGKSGDDIDNSLKAFNTKNKQIIDLNFNGDIHNVSFYNKDMYFISTQKYSLYGDNKPYLIKFDNDSLQTINNASELFDASTEEKQLIIGRWNYQTNKTFFVKDLSDALSSIPQKIEVNQNGTILRILSQDILYDLQIQK